MNQTQRNILFRYAVAIAATVSLALVSSLHAGPTGQLWAFGKNYNGQLGDGTTGNHTDPVQVIVGVSAVSSGGSATEGSHTFYLKPDGTLWAVGYNQYGQLGDGTTASRSTPVQVASGVRAVSAGINHSLILKNDGTLWATGLNQYGQLGDGTTTNRSTPILVASGVSAIAAGGNHTLYVKTDGTLWAAGYNSFGQLGDGTKPTNQIVPVQVATGVSAIATGGSHSLILKSDGSLWVSGSNASGQLGVGPGSSYLSVLTPLTTGVQAIACGNQHSLFLKIDGTLWSMGQNLFGQLGDGTMPTNQKYPVQVASRVSEVAAGASHSLYLTTDTTLWAMGLNSSGQLGDGTTTNRGAPIPVADEVLGAAGGSESSYFIKAPGLTTQLNSWTTLSSGPANSFHRVIYADGQFVAGSMGVAPLGGGGLSLLSTDGLSWMASNGGALTNIDLHGLAYGNGLYVAVGEVEVGSGGATITSVDGISWTASVPTTQSLESVTCGNNLFVAVGEGGLIQTSSDGSIWTVRSSGTAASLRGVTHGGSRFVAVGSAGTVLSSTDGMNWTTQVSGASGASNNLASVTYGNGLFVAVGNGIVTSPDGVTWTQILPAVSDGTNYYAVTYRVGQYVAVGTSNAAQGAILSSADGITWTTHNPGTSDTLRGVDHGANRFVVVGDNGTVLTSALVGSAPVIISDPVSQSVSAGTPVSFSVAAIGAPPFTYQWRRNNANIPGATGATYSIAAPDSADAGSLTAVVTNAAGNVTSAAATLTVLKANQTISFAALPTRYYGDAPFAVNATANPSGLPVSFSVLSGPATISDGMITVTGVGTVTIRASQAGNISYYAAPNVDRSFSVVKATPAITWATPAAITYGTALSGAQLNAASGVPGTITYSPASGAMLNVGLQTLTAAFTPTDATNYNTASAVQTVTVNKATATVVLGNLASLYDGTPKPVSVSTTPSSLAVSVTYDGSPAVPINVGNYAVVATINNTNYQGSTSGTLTIVRGQQTITFNAIPTHTFGDAPFALVATTSASLPVGFSVMSGPATISGSVVTMTGVGTVTIRASQSGNAYFNAAPDVDQSFLIAKPTPQITWAAPSSINYGTPLSSVQLNASANVPGTFTYNPAIGSVLPAGSQTLTAIFSPTDATNYNGASAQQTLTVGKAPASIALGNLSVTYDGTSKHATALTNHDPVNVDFLYNGSSAEPVNAGSYTVIGIINDANYTGTATGTLMIAKASPLLGWAAPASLPYGTALSSTQLNATANVPGAFAYSPVSGTILNVGPQLLTANFTPADTSNYLSASAQQTLTVIAGGATLAPNISTQPLDQVANVGASATFTVSATGIPSPTFQWRKNGIAIAGAVGTTYSMPSVQLVDEADYTVLVSNSVGSIISRSARLTLNATIIAPSITGQPAGMTATAGATVTFAVQVGGFPSPALQWKRNNLDISGATSSTYTITGVMLADAANYTVVATNLAGSVSSSIAALVVQAATYPAKFDALGYLAKNPDVAVVVGANLNAAWQHYWDYGLAEGRIFDDLFRVDEYLALYPDLQARFGSDRHQALLQWLEQGQAEGRLGRVPVTFNVAGYLARYSDLQTAFGVLGEIQRRAAAWNHYINYGVFEGRNDGDFVVLNYLATYTDLRLAFGTDLKAAALQWYLHGRYEGRRIPAGFDVQGYLTRNSDVKAAYGLDLYGAWLHYLYNGVNEGRVFDDLFRADEYVAMYADLQAAFGNNRQAALMHWLTYGRNEGRLGRVPVTFDTAVYLARYADLQAAFGGLADGQRRAGAWGHYIDYGVYEGRTDGDFEVNAYLAQYADLQVALGNDIQAVALQWYMFGRYEGRRIPLNFDAQGYLIRNPDVAAIFRGDLYGAWLQYRDFGINEGRVFDDLFRVDEYLTLYPDLQAAFGNDREAALIHWLLFGKNEGRRGRF